MEKHEHNFQPANYNGACGDIRMEVLEINGIKKWEDYMVLYCNKCGEIKKVIVPRI